MKKIWTKALAYVLAVTMCLSAVNVPIYAQGSTVTEVSTEAETTSEAVTEEATVSGSDAEASTEEVVSTEEATTDGNDGSTWDQVTTENVFEGENYKVTFKLTSNWDAGYNANVKLENTGDSTIQNWYLGFDYNDSITSIWNAEISSNEGNKYIIKNAGWNQDIAVGNSIEFGLSGDHAFKGFPENYELIGTSTEVTEDDYSIQYNVDSDWGIGFTGNIQITNNTDKILEDWVLEFDFEREITGIWNGVIEEHEGNHYVIRNVEYNSNIASGECVSIGIKGCEGESGDEPVNYKLTTIADDEEIMLTVNTGAFFYNESADWYVIKDEICSLSGTLVGADAVKNIDYEITDLNETIVKKGTLEVAESWTLNNIGFSVGYNKLKITVLKRNGKKETFSIAFMNYNIGNLENANVDLTDTDEDGLSNYYETLLGTDINKVDTDDDRLSDYEEFLYTGTEPTLSDTDGNGIIDSEEDFDKDGLNNLKEIQFQTNCYLADTDDDGGSDGNEVKIYYTNPTVWDTDGDGLSDFQDIEMQFDPNLKDTDNDGIIDGEERVYQNYKEEIENEHKTEILSVEINTECSGYLGEKATIIDTYNLDMRSSEVVGLIGVPVNISVDADFTTADITFTYDENALGNTDEENLAMMWYNEEKDQYIVLDSIVDTEHNTVTYTTTHFSTYLIIDKQIWLDNMRMDLNYRNSGDVTYYDMAMVVDVSGSMSGKRLSNAKTALNRFVDAMMDNDQAGLVKFASSATTLVELTNNKEDLKEKVLTLSAGGGTNANAGILKGISVLDSSDVTREKMMILVCDGDVSYIASTVQAAIDKGITIHCVNVVNGNSTAMQRIANETGGIYYYAATTADIEKVIEELTGDTVETIDMTDTDGDGLYDVYETNGMRLSNGQIVYTDPNNVDSNGDGINDYDAMGGAPVTESIVIDGKTYSCTLNHSSVYGKMSAEFIYVDGTINTDGKQYYGEMSYIPYSDSFKFNKYQKEMPYRFNGEERTVYGDAGIYNSFNDKLATISNAKLLEYAAIGTYTAMAVSLIDTQASACLYLYIQGTGGSEEGLVAGSTREYIYATPRLGTNIFGINSANEYFMSNMNRVKICVESVLNEYNTEAYIALSPSTTWTGCAYNDCTMDNWRQNIDSLLNIGAFGIYNKADAGVTVHCIYDPDTEQYSMEFNYYIIDLYDFTLYDQLDEMNALGLARCYELYGVSSGVSSWNKNDEYDMYWMY